MIKIRSPRYRDKVVLIARYKLACGQDVEIEIQEGAYKGIYKISNRDLCDSPIETMKTRNGLSISMRAVPLEKLERIGEVVENF